MIVANPAPRTLRGAVLGTEFFGHEARVKGRDFVFTGSRRNRMREVTWEVWQPG
jgi:hypothetical protein